MEFTKILIERTKGSEKIRLKDEYPWLSGDEYIEITDEIAEVFNVSRRTKTPATGRHFALCGAPSCSNPQSLARI
ncbi:MAG: hypothetical protein IJE70_07455 [Oscillospiraceae bacterium]|nr:hypothetical protein [Oscillospiraceae bacterium]